MSLKASLGLILEAFGSNLTLISLGLIDLRNVWSYNKPEGCLIPCSLSPSSHLKSRRQLHREMSPPTSRAQKLWQMSLKLPQLRLVFHYHGLPPGTLFYTRCNIGNFLLYSPITAHSVSNSVSNWIFFFFSFYIFSQGCQLCSNGISLRGERARERGKKKKKNLRKSAPCLHISVVPMKETTPGRYSEWPATADLVFS